MTDQLTVRYREQCFLFSKACFLRSSKYRQTHHRFERQGSCLKLISLPVVAAREETPCSPIRPFASSAGSQKDVHPRATSAPHELVQGLCLAQVQSKFSYHYGLTSGNT